MQKKYSSAENRSCNILVLIYDEEEKDPSLLFTLSWHTDNLIFSYNFL